MEVTDIREASGRVVVALVTAGRSRTTIKRYEAEFNAFAGFLEARGQALPTEADCLDFIAERSGSRVAGLREPTQFQACPTRTPAAAPADGRPGWRHP